LADIELASELGRHRQTAILAEQPLAVGDEAPDVGRRSRLKGVTTGRKNAFDPRCGHDFNAPGNAHLSCNEAPETSSGRNPPRRRLCRTLIGRVNTTAGPSVVAIRHNGVFDIMESAATVADLCNAPIRCLARSKGGGWASW